MTEQDNARSNATGPDSALQAISNGLVHLMSESYGRGPTRAKTYILDDTTFSEPTRTIRPG